MKTMPTIRDVARKTGLSISTVSRALRGLPRFSEATRETVLQAAKELGYQPNPMLAALSAHRWSRPRHQIPSGDTLAILADGRIEGHAGMLERVATHGYRTEVFQIKDYPDPKRLSQLLFNRGILGIVVGQIYTPGFCAAFDWSRFVSIACCEGHERPPVDLVMPNHFLAMQEGWMHARALGYRRIGLMMFDDEKSLDVHDRQAAFMDRQQEMPAKDRIPVLRVSPLWTSLGKTEAQKVERIRVVKEWLARYQPDVVLGFNGLFQWIINDAGWHVPEKVAFICLWISKPDPTSTGMLLSVEETGRRAVDWLDLLLRAGERGIPAHPSTILIDMVWQPGSTAPGVR